MSNRKLLDAIYADGNTTESPPDMKVSHHFGAGTYVRSSFVPKGRAIKLHVHPYEHLAIVGMGGGKFIREEETVYVKPGDVLTAKAGERHAYVAEEDTIWLCVHGTTEEEAKKLYGG